MKLPPTTYKSTSGFTLIELLVVISIIAVLAAILLPVVSSVTNRARSVQAKNDELQIVAAVKAYNTEYGTYPLTSDQTANGQDSFTYGENAPKSAVLIDILRANTQEPLTQTLNPRMINFIELPTAKDAAHPKGGLGPVDRQPYDPWGRAYIIRIDANYDGMVENPYGSNAGSKELSTPVIVWSFGADRAGVDIGGDKNSGAAKDDVISWQ